MQIVEFTRTLAKFGDKRKVITIPEALEDIVSKFQNTRLKITISTLDEE
jgi:hypothetical protein